MITAALGFERPPHLASHIKTHRITRRDPHLMTSANALARFAGVSQSIYRIVLKSTRSKNGICDDQ